MVISPSALKRFFIGKPIASSEDAHHRLSKKVALPVFASDAISSTAYATEQVLIVFLSIAAIGMTAFDYLVPVSLRSFRHFKTWRHTELNFVLAS